VLNVPTNLSQKNVFALGVLMSVKDVDDLLGSIITCAEPGDVLKSKVCAYDEFGTLFLKFLFVASIL
jgi:hypothetical protein